MSTQPVLVLVDGSNVARCAAWRRPCPGTDSDDELRRRIATALRTELSPRHIPDEITAVPVVPHNRTGKKLELPVKKILLGAAPGSAASRSNKRE